MKASGTGERASATVEFALVLPLILIMALALVQVGLFMKDQLVVEEAARAGARQAAVSRDDGEARAAAVRAAASLDASRMEVSVQRDGGAGSAVVVRVLYGAPVVVPAVGWLLPPSVQLTSTVTMRQEVG